MGVLPKVSILKKIFILSYFLSNIQIITKGPALLLPLDHMNKYIIWGRHEREKTHTECKNIFSIAVCLELVSSVNK